MCLETLFTENDNDNNYNRQQAIKSTSVLIKTPQ